MKPLLLLFVVTAGLCSCGLSARKENKKLVKACALEQQKQEEAITTFKQSRKEFDSIKLVANDKIFFLKDGEKKIVDQLLTHSGLIYQLNELKAEIPTLTTDPKGNRIMSYKEFVEPIQKTLMAVTFFGKVSNEVNVKDLSKNEQNKLLTRKLEEYRHAALANSLRQEELQACYDRISAFLPGMDSLLWVYQTQANGLTSDNWKLEDKLKQLEAEFRKKGPAGFPEAYFLIFPEVFPGFVSSGKKMQLNTVPVQNALAEDAEPMGMENNNPGIRDWAEEFASFPGGKEAMDQFISKNLNLPQSVLERIISGKVYVKFIVSEKGEISAVQVLKGIPACPECSEEAIRLVNSMPNWVPGTENGKAVSLYVRLPVKFEL